MVNFPATNSNKIHKMFLTLHVCLKNVAAHIAVRGRTGNAKGIYRGEREKKVIERLFTGDNRAGHGICF